LGSFLLIEGGRRRRGRGKKEGGEGGERRRGEKEGGRRGYVCLIDTINREYIQ